MKIRKFIIITTLLVIGILMLGFSVRAMSKASGNNHDQQTVYFGLFREGAPGNINHIKKFEEQVGFKPAMVMWYQDWDQNFPWDDAMNAVKYGAVPHIVWEPWYWSDHSKIDLNDIIDGKWDKYIRTWAREIKTFRHPVFLRVAHEFNIEGYPWGVVNNDKDPELYVKAYRHIVDIFKKEKVQNVKWVWCFMNFSHPNETWNDWAAAYPGDEYVDWVGIDGYNWGSVQDWSDWQSFKVLFRDPVRRAKKLWPKKPIMVAEFASAEKGGDKGAWIREIPAHLKSSLRDIDLIIWFDLRKEANWQIKSSKQSLAAFEKIMKDPIFSSSGEALAKLEAPPKKFARKKAIAQKALSPVVIDGKLTEWKKAGPISLQGAKFFKEGIDWKGDKDLSGEIYIMWDDDNLYVAAEVDDDYPMINNQKKRDVWNGDSIEIVMSVDPKADSSRTSFQRGDYQLGFSTGNGKDNPAEIWNWQRRRTPKGSKIVVKKKEKPLGYVLEAKIPWEFFRVKETLGRGTKIGFDVAIDDADATGKREKQLIWNGDFFFYKDPSVWGVLELK